MKHFLHAAKLIISIGLIAWLFFQVDWTHTLSVLKNFDLSQLFPLFILSLAGILLSIWKWSFVLQALHHQHTYWHLLKIFWAGLFLNNFLPGRTGGDIYRTYGIAQDTGSKTKAAISVIIDRVLNLIALILIGFISFFYSAKQLAFEINIMQFTGMLVAISVMTMLVFYLTRHTEISQKICDSINHVAQNPYQLIIPFALAILYQLAMILSHVVVFRGLGQHIDAIHFFYLIPITALATLLPISINGIGLRESTFVLVFNQMGVASEHALSLSLIITFFTMMMSLVGCLFYALGHTKNLHLSSKRI